MATKNKMPAGSRWLTGGDCSAEYSYFSLATDTSSGTFYAKLRESAASKNATSMNSSWYQTSKMIQHPQHRKKSERYKKAPRPNLKQVVVVLQQILVGVHRNITLFT